MTPSVLIGIDIGGTFTDAVAVRAGTVVGTTKVPTVPENLSVSLLDALDGVLDNVPETEVARISLSTTLITNLLAQGQVPKAAVLLIPGPGRDPSTYRLGVPSWVVKGAIDFRGREIAPLDRDEVRATLQEIHVQGYRHLAVAGKFSPRNPSHEQRVLDWAREIDPQWKLCAAHTVSGQLNLPRRAAAAALTVAVSEPYRIFFDQLQAALGARGLACPIVVLKADGGTLPLEAAKRAPIQSIFSGPAASAMGVLAQRPEGSTSVVVDIGGTTTDLALILDGTPLFSSRGGTLDGIYLPTRAFAVCSLPVGGDSTVTAQGEDGQIVLEPRRAGVAACLGGPAPTLTDALRLLGRTTVGDEARARTSLEGVGLASGLDASEVASQVVEQALVRIEGGITAMFARWRREQIYRIWQLKQRRERHPDVVVGVGAAAEPLVPALAERLNARALIPPYAPVANALGAAVARTTYATSLHIDTERRRFEVAEEGLSADLPDGDYTLEEAEQIARQWAERRGKALGIADPLVDCEVVLAEQFNVVDGWYTVGRIFDVRLERRCGLVEEWGRELSQLSTSQEA
jgi:N-methylhydantoinase A/oxoprolinase/acetone carboxylase beta subunit